MPRLTRLDPASQYLLAFTPSQSSLKLHKTIRAEGPHQYIALSADRSKAYATTWAQPPTLSAWNILDRGRSGIQHINTVPISAFARGAADPRGHDLTKWPPRSCYVIVHLSLAVLPPSNLFSWRADRRSARCRARDRWIRREAAGNALRRTGKAGIRGQDSSRFGMCDHTPAHETNLRDVDSCPCRGTAVTASTSTKSEGRCLYPTCRSQVTLFVQTAEAEIRTPTSGHNSIFMYNVLEDGELSLVANCPSAASTEPDAHEDGPRHNIPSPDGSKLYAVTEHSKLSSCVEGCDVETSAATAHDLTLTRLKNSVIQPRTWMFTRSARRR
jgi:hypothetical protein